MKVCDLLSPPDYKGPYQHVRFSWAVQVVGEEYSVDILSSGCEIDTLEPFCCSERLPAEKARTFWRKLRKQGWIARVPTRLPRPSEGSKLFKNAEEIEKEKRK